MRRTTRHHQDIGFLDPEARDIRAHPIEGRCRHVGNPRHRKLLGLAINRVHVIALLVGMGVRGEPRNSRPFGPTPGQHDVKIAARPVRGLEVVDPVELSPLEAMPQPKPGAPVLPAGALVDPDIIEPAACLEKLPIGRAGQQGDMRILVMFTDRGKRTGCLHDIAQRTELDHEYARGRIAQFLWLSNTAA